MKQITKDMTIGEVLNINKNAKVILTGFGMHCFSCPMSQMETLEEAGQVHGIDVDLMLQKLNEPVAVEAKKKATTRTKVKKNK